MRGSRAYKAVHMVPGGGRHEAGRGRQAENPAGSLQRQVVQRCSSMHSRVAGSRRTQVPEQAGRGRPRETGRQRREAGRHRTQKQNCRCGLRNPPPPESGMNPRNR